MAQACLLCHSGLLTFNCTFANLSLVMPRQANVKSTRTVINLRTAAKRRLVRLQQKWGMVSIAATIERLLDEQAAIEGRGVVSVPIAPPASSMPHPAEDDEYPPRY